MTKPISKNIYLCIDAGTSLIKAYALDENGREIMRSSRPNIVVQKNDGTAIQDMNLVWQKACECIYDINLQIPKLKNKVVAISVTGQGDGTWMLDARGEPFDMALTWLDGRSMHVAERYRETDFFPFFYNSTGCTLTTDQQCMQLSWMKETYPEKVKQAATIFHCKDWLYYKLSGDIITDFGEGCASYGDIRKRQYNKQILDALDMPELENKLPQMIDPTTSVGKLKSDVADVLGLLSETPIVLCSLDVTCAAIGADVANNSKKALTIFGTAAIHMAADKNIITAQETDDLVGFQMVLPGTKHILKTRGQLAGTLNLDWIVSVAKSLTAMFGTEINTDDIGALLDTLLGDKAIRNKALYHPYIHPNGERSPFVNKNAAAMLNNLSNRTDFRELSWAVLEGMALGARDCYESLMITPNEITVTGGGSNSAQLCQMLANVLQAKVNTTKHSFCALGATRVAAVAVGATKNLQQSCEEILHPVDVNASVILPDQTVSSYYEARFKSYNLAREQAIPVWASLENEI